MSNLIIPGQEPGLKDPIQAKLDERKREQEIESARQEIRENRELAEQRARYEATRKAFKGIYDRHTLVAKARVGMARLRAMEDQDG